MDAWWGLVDEGGSDPESDGGDRDGGSDEIPNPHPHGPNGSTAPGRRNGGKTRNEEA